jgi:hypothetical protein
VTFESLGIRFHLVSFALSSLEMNIQFDHQSSIGPALPLDLGCSNMTKHHSDDCLEL